MLNVHVHANACINVKIMMNNSSKLSSKKKCSGLYLVKRQSRAGFVLMVLCIKLILNHKKT